MSYTFEQLCELYAETYPGFPPMVHAIMAHVNMGKTPDEAAELVGNFAEQIDKGIQAIDETHAKYTEDGRFELPSNIPQIDEEEGGTDAMQK